MKLSRQLRIFLLYAHHDEHDVCHLYRRLVKTGADVWLDKEKLLPGQDWQYEIRKAIHGSDLAIVCLSRQFNKQGGYRHKELEMVVEKANLLSEAELFVIPARLQKCDIPGPLGRWQRVDLFEANGFKKLIDAVQAWAASS